MRTQMVSVHNKHEKTFNHMQSRLIKVKECYTPVQIKLMHQAHHSVHFPVQAICRAWVIYIPDPNGSLVTTVQCATNMARIIAPEPTAASQQHIQPGHRVLSLRLEAWLTKVLPTKAQA